jgi:putative transposase
MPRTKLIRSERAPYHVTARSNNRETFHCEPKLVWEILSDHCLEASYLWNAQTHALVLMPNHFHLLISIPEYDLGRVMERFMRSVTKTMNRLSGRSGRVFGGPYHRSVVGSSLYFAHAFKYVYRNPVRARICEAVEQYPYSTLYGQLGKARLSFPLYYPFGLDHYPKLPAELDRLVEWLNCAPKPQHDEDVRTALKKSIFEAPKSGWKRKRSLLLS